MTLWSRLADVIAGPQVVRASQERSSEKLYAGLERKASDASDILPEVSPEQPIKSISPILSLTPQGSISPPRRLRPNLLRSYSDLPEKTTFAPKPKQDMTEFPPDITAMDLTSDQLKRNYSSNDLQSADNQRWNPKLHPMPPLFPLTGEFRYRCAAGASPEWKNQFVKSRIDSLGCLSSMVAELDDSDVTRMIGLEPDRMQRIHSDRARRSSAISSASAPVGSSSDLQEMSLDPETGTKILRGFSPPSSSSRSSFASRKGSTLSIVTTASDYGPSTPLTPQDSDTDRRGSGPLPTINETSSLCTDFTKKIERPCDFSDAGDPDSAVASDDDDEEWADIAPRNTSISGIAQLMQGRKREELPVLTKSRTTSSEKERKARGSNTALDRSRTIRATRAVPPRRKSKTKSSAGDYIAKTGDIVDPHTGKPPVLSNSNEDSDAGLTMKFKPTHRANLRKPTAEATLVDDNPFFQNYQLNQATKTRERSTTMIRTIDVSPTAIV